jgi:hypothetical protein
MYPKIFYATLRALTNVREAIVVCLLCVVIASCQKSLSDADLLQSKFDSGMVSYVEGGNQVTLNGVNYSFTPFYVGVPLSLKNAAKVADTITAVVDPTLVAQYNQIYAERNPSFTDGAFQVSHQGTFPLSLGAAQAKDSLYVQLTDGSQLKDSTVYLVPVSLAAKHGSALKYSVSFFKVFVTKSNLKAKMYGASVINGYTANRLSSGALSLYYSTVPDSLKFRVSLNTLFPAHDVQVQATLLNATEVNAAILKEGFYGYPAPLPVPDNTSLLKKDLVTVPARSLLSRDSLTLTFPNKGYMQKWQWYVMGVKIVSYTGSQYGVPPVANDSTRAYIRFFLY